MGSRVITDEFVRQVTEDLRARYSLDANQVRLLAARVASAHNESRSAENRAFAVRFTERHGETVDRLAR